jgi:hypothetical protein
MTPSRALWIGLTGWLALVPAASAGISLVSSNRTLRILAQSGQSTFIDQSTSGPATGPYNDRAQQSGPSGSTDVTVEADQDTTVTLTPSGGLAVSGAGHGSTSGSLLSPGPLQLMGTAQTILTFRSDAAFTYDITGYVMASPNTRETQGSLLLTSSTTPSGPVVFEVNSSVVLTTEPQTINQRGALPPGVYTLDASAFASDQGGAEDARFVLQFTATPGTGTVVPLPPAWAQGASLAALATPLAIMRLRRTQSPGSSSRR